MLLFSVFIPKHFESFGGVHNLLNCCMIFRFHEMFSQNYYVKIVARSLRCLFFCLVYLFYLSYNAQNTHEHCVYVWFKLNGTMDHFVAYFSRHSLHFGTVHFFSRVLSSYLFVCLWFYIFLLCEYIWMYLFNSEQVCSQTHERTQFHFWRTLGRHARLLVLLTIYKTNWPKMSILYLYTV